MAVLDPIKQTVERPDWTFLSNHGHVLVCLASDPEMRVREIAVLVGIGERAVQAILNDLVEAGYVTRERVGRRNRYQLQTELPLRHPLEGDRNLGDLVTALTVRPARRD